MSQKNLSRRTFLTGTALAGAGAALAGLAGCAPAAEDKAKGEEALSQTGAETPAATASAGDFAIAAVKVADAGTPVKECDYLVIGAGNCGMMSAAHAGSLGLSTIVLEKTSITSGSSVGTEVTMGFSDNKPIIEGAKDPNIVNVSQEAGTPAEIYDWFMKHNSYKANAELVSNYIKNNHRQHDFLYDHGARPMMLLPSLDAPTNGIMYEGQGIGAHDVMESAAREYGVEILVESPATALVVDDQGAVVGAMATIDGSEGYVAAKAVFVGTGGFSNNEAMVEALIPGWGPLAWKNDGHLAHDGDGICMMLGAGAVPSDTSFAQPAGSGVEGATWESAIDRAGREPYLWVNRVGERLANEKWTTMDQTYKVAINQDDYCYFNIIDSNAVKRMQTEPFMCDARTVLGSNDPMENMGEELEAGVESGLLYKGETLAELAQAAGIDPEGLEATVAAYNELCKKGEDDQFFKPAEYLFALEEGPFYALRNIPGWYSTLCGVKINGKIQVIDETGHAIPGLYAGGLDSGEFFKDDYYHGFSGSCSGYSYFTGFFAADMAKEYIDSL